MSDCYISHAELTPGDLVRIISTEEGRLVIGVAIVGMHVTVTWLTLWGDSQSMKKPLWTHRYLRNSRSYLHFEFIERGDR